MVSIDCLPNLSFVSVTESFTCLDLRAASKRRGPEDPGREKQVGQ